MHQIQTVYGNVIILDLQAIFEKIVNKIELVAKNHNQISIGLTGGSTPKAFYHWAIQQHALKQEVLDKIVWMTSDERYLPLENSESNFGNADRLMLTPLSVPEKNKRPWPVSLAPHEAASIYNNYFDQKKCFDLCMLGMGDDCHIASIFPDSPLISTPLLENFTSIDVPNKGVRLTITPNGLSLCQQIIMIVTGSSKSTALAKVLHGPFNPLIAPAQLTKNWANKVTWLIDTSSAAELYL